MAVRAYCSSSPRIRAWQRRVEDSCGRGHQAVTDKDGGLCRTKH